MTAWSNEEKIKFQESLDILKESLGDNFMESSEINILNERGNYRNLLVTNNELDKDESSVMQFSFIKSKNSATEFLVFVICKTI